MQQWLCQLRRESHDPGQTGWVHHLSARGLMLFVEEPLPLDQSVEVLLLNQRATFALRQSLTVLRCDPLSGGSWFVAAAFPRPLRPEELRPFLT